MATKIYGESDDLIEFEGEVIRDEIGAFGTDEEEHGVLVLCSDGTLLEVKYGKAGMAVWGSTVLKPGTLFDRLEPCFDEDAHPHSDVVHFRAGLKWAYAAKQWVRVSPEGHQF